MPHPKIAEQKQFTSLEIGNWLVLKAKNRIKSVFGEGNWNALKNDVEDSADLIFFHSPYHDINLLDMSLPKS